MYMTPIIVFLYITTSNSVCHSIESKYHIHTLYTIQYSATAATTSLQARDMQLCTSMVCMCTLAVQQSICTRLRKFTVACFVMCSGVQLVLFTHNTVCNACTHCTLSNTLAYSINRATVKVKLPQGVEQPLSAFWDGGDHTERLESAEGNGESLQMQFFA
jgi:hypothetical protein